jgi:hypothetical protein
VTGIPTRGCVCTTHARATARRLLGASPRRLTPAPPGGLPHPAAPSTPRGTSHRAAAVLSRHAWAPSAPSGPAVCRPRRCAQRAARPGSLVGWYSRRWTHAPHRLGRHPVFLAQGALPGHGRWRFSSGFSRAFPAGTSWTLVADRGFPSAALFPQLRHGGTDFRVRLRWSDWVTVDQDHRDRRESMCDTSYSHTANT